MLNLRNRGSLKIDGTVRVNGFAIKTLKDIASVSAYVQQDDIFIDTLRVGEHLLFQAFLRMGRHTGNKERSQRIEQAMIYVRRSLQMSFFFISYLEIN